MLHINTDHEYRYTLRRMTIKNIREEEERRRTRGIKYCDAAHPHEAKFIY